MEIQKQMLDLIIKDLPKQTAGVLKDYLEEAQDLKEKVESLQTQLKTEKEFLTKKLEDANKSLTDLRTRLNDAENRIKSDWSIQHLHDVTIAAQKNIDLAIARNDIESLKRENQAIMNLAATVFRNPTFTTVERKDTPIAVQGANGYSGFVQNATETKTTTTEQT